MGNIMSKIIFIFCVLIVLASCDKDGNDRFRVITIDQDPNSGLNWFDDCIALDLDQNEQDDIEFCYRQRTSSGGINESYSYLNILNNNVSIATTDTEDYYQTCRWDSLWGGVVHECYRRRLVDDYMHCHEDGEVDIVEFEDQGYPTIHYIVPDQFPLGINYKKDVKLLSYRDGSYWGDCADTRYSRGYWDKVENGYIFFKIRNDIDREGWIELSGSFIHSMAIEK